MSFETMLPALEATDPKMIRALAHPTRLALLDHLHLDGPATATECGDALRESPAACSYHLRALARWGLVEEAGGGRGRERPWRLRARSIDFSNVGSREHEAATGLLASEMLRRNEAATRTFLSREREFDPEWRDAATFSSGALNLTAEELRELTTRYKALMREYAGRRAPGSRRVDVMFRALPRPD